MTSDVESQKKAGCFGNLFYNIILPVLILKFGNKLIKKQLPQFEEQGPVIVLIVALAFPVVYGAMDFFKSKNVNFVSILGFINILMTGGLALLNLVGWWMVVKEGAFPLVIGVVVVISAFTKKSLIEIFLYNPEVIRVDAVESRLKELGREDELKAHLRRCTIYISVSFFISAGF